MSKRNIQPDELLLRVMSALQRKPEEKPEGFLTLEEWATKWDKSRSTTSKFIHKAIALGLMEERRFMAACRPGARVYPTAHYREKTRPAGR